MSEPWILSMPRASAAAMRRLRLRRDITVCEAQDRIWLRGESLDESLARSLRLLPEATLFAVMSGGRLRARGERLGRGRVPDGEWVPLGSWVRVTAPAAALGGVVPEKVELRVRRTSREAEPNLLLTDFQRFHAYALRAARVRLQSLRFARSLDGRSLIWGTPIPPLEGVRHVERSGVAIRCGWTFEPAVDPAAVRGLLRLSPGEIALFDATGRYERIDGRNFVAASRSAVRRSASPDA